MNFTNYMHAMLLGGLLSSALHLDAHFLEVSKLSEQQKKTLKATAKKVGIGSALAGLLLASGGGIYYYFCMLPKIRQHEQEQQEFCGTVWASNFEKMDELLAQGKRLDAKYFKKGGNLLHEIIQRGPHEGPHPTEIPHIKKGILSVIKYMGNEIDLNQVNERGVTPLFAAIHEIQRFPDNMVYVDQQLAVIDMLVAEGVDKDSIGGRGLGTAKGSLLHAAACIDKNPQMRNYVIMHLQYQTGVDQYIQDPDFKKTYYDLLPKK